MNEIWKDIDGYNGAYQVSNLGRVRHIQTNILKADYRPTRKEYAYAQARISIRGKHYSIHRLVAQTFIPNPKKLPQVNHKDGNTRNNRVENLEWCTAKDNTKHAIETGLKKLKVPLEKYEYVCAEYLKGRTMKNIGEEFGVHDTRIRDILKKSNVKIRKKGGYEWK